MKFLIDRWAGAKLAQWLREQGHDALYAGDRDADPGDEELLAEAAADGRALVTIDKDFGMLVFAKWAPHRGLVRLPDVPAAERIALFERLLATHQSDIARARSSRCAVTASGFRAEIGSRTPGTRSSRLASKGAKGAGSTLTSWRLQKSYQIPG